MRARLWICLALLLVVPSSAAGHAQPIGAAVDDSGALRIVLSGPAEPAFLEVRDGQGRRLDARVDASDNHTIVVDGTDRSSLLTLRVLSRDGHVVTAREVATNSAGRVTEATSVLSVVADLLVFVGLLSLFGVLAARFGVFADAWRSGGIGVPGVRTPAWSVAAETAAIAIVGRLRRLWWGAFTVAAVGLILSVVGLLAELDTADLGGLTDTRWVRAWLVQVICIFVVAFGARFASSAPGASASPMWLAGYLLGVAAVAAAWAGHAGSGNDAVIGVGLDAAHLIATGAWLGGLVALLAILPLLDAERIGEDATRLGAAVVVRFSSLAIMCVAVLVVSGTYRAIAELSAVDDLVDTGYGRALLVKLVLFVVLLIGGAVNRLVFHPRMERAALGLRIDDGGASRTLRQSVRAEIVLALALLVVVAVMVNLPPP